MDETFQKVWQWVSGVSCLWVALVFIAYGNAKRLGREEGRIEGQREATAVLTGPLKIEDLPARSSYEAQMAVYYRRLYGVR